MKQEFIDRMKEYLKDDFNAFMDSFNEANVRGLRLNNKYIDNKTFENIFNYDISPIYYIDNGYYLNTIDKMGYHPLHHAGAFYLQDPSAMGPLASIKMKKDALVLDLCAAPGGKTTQAALQVPDGVVISNEIDYTRAKALYSNVERMGLNNVIITNNKVSDFLPLFEGVFDYVILDAPCSGEGMFRKYDYAMDEWSLNEVELCHNRDLELIDYAYRLLKKDGVLIYSTCTYAKEENEEPVEYLMSKHNASYYPINEKLLEVVSKGINNDYCYRFYPHKIKGEGQFLSVIQKNEEESNNLRLLKKLDSSKAFDEFVKSYLKPYNFNLILKNNYLYAMPLNIDLKGLKVISYGVKLGQIENNRFVPDHFFFKAYSDLFNSQINLDYKDINIEKYLRGEEIDSFGEKGYGVIKVNNIPLGGYKSSNNRAKNYYPKGLRNK